MAACVVCGGRSDAPSSLCEDCADRLATTVGLCPEQLVSGGGGDGRGGALVDQWGRPHMLADRAVIGRDLETADLAVLEGGISRRHAELVRADGSRWTLRDLGSTNGTFLNGEPVSGIVTIQSGSLVTFSQVGMYFVHGAALPRTEADGIRSTVRPQVPTTPPRRPLDLPDEALEEVTGVGMPSVRLRFSVPSGTAAGVLEVEGKHVQLTATQLQFVRLLADRMVAESTANELVRGFVSSAELLSALMWETPHPDENHLKQLVRRVRRALSRADIGNLIDSRRGFGYRFRAVPLIEDDA